MNVKVTAVMSAPRYGNHMCRGSVESALQGLGVPLKVYHGVFWHHTLTELFMDAVFEHDCEWILCFDHDTMCHSEDVVTLLRHAVKHDADAVAAMQVKRGSADPLFSKTRNNDKDTLMQVSTAHFGCTAIKCAALKRMPMPWFWEVPDLDGTWGKRAHTCGVHPALAATHEALGEFFACDADIWFWHNWNWCGNEVYVDAAVRVGHMEEMVTYFSAPGRIEHVTYGEWIKLQQQINEARRARDDAEAEELRRAPVARAAGHNGSQGDGAPGDSGRAEERAQTPALEP